MTDLLQLESLVPGVTTRNSSVERRMERRPSESIPDSALMHKLVIRIKHKFQQRMIEWLAAAQLTCLGVILLLPAKAFDTSLNYIAMSEWGSETQWGIFLICSGLLGLTGLFVNGSMEAVTPWVRVVRALIGAIAFSMIVISAIISWAVYGIPLAAEVGIYLPMVCFEFIAIFHAIVDARTYSNGRRNTRGFSKRHR